MSEEKVFVVEDRSELSNGNEVGNLSFVTGVDDDGTLSTLSPTEALGEDSQEKGKKKGAKESSGLSSLLSVEKDDLILVALAKNFASGYKIGTKMTKEVKFYALPKEGAKEAFKELEKALENPQLKESKELLTSMRVSVQGDTKKITPNDINWEFLNSKGVTKEMLEERGELDQLLTKHKTNLIPMVLEIDGEKVSTEGRIRIFRMADGNCHLSYTVVKDAPKLEEEYYGYKFTDEDKKNLLESGNLGKRVELENKYTKEKYTAYVSIDPQTNDIVHVRANRIVIPASIRNVNLTKDQHQALVEGKEIFIENFQSKAGNEYSQYVQIDADKGGLSFYFKRPANLQEKFLIERDVRNGLRGVPRQLLGTPLTETQRIHYKNGETIFVQGMTGKDGKFFDSFITKGQDGKPKFSKFPPNAMKSDIVAQAEKLDTKNAQKNVEKKVDTPKVSKKGGMKI